MRGTSEQQYQLFLPLQPLLKSSHTKAKLNINLKVYATQPLLLKLYIHQVDESFLLLCMLNAKAKLSP
jgi:hypothetical protein